MIFGQKYVEPRLSWWASAPARLQPLYLEVREQADRHRELYPAGVIAGDPLTGADRLTAELLLMQRMAPLWS